MRPDFFTVSKAEASKTTAPNARLENKKNRSVA